MHTCSLVFSSNGSHTPKVTASGVRIWNWKSSSRNSQLSLSLLTGTSHMEGADLPVPASFFASAGEKNSKKKCCWVCFHSRQAISGAFWGNSDSVFPNLGADKLHCSRRRSPKTPTVGPSFSQGIFYRKRTQCSHECRREDI